MGIASVILAIGRTFIHPDLVGALIGVSSAGVFYWVYRNPGMLMARSFDEFGEYYDNSRDKKYLWGFPLYQLLILCVILYFWLR